MAQGEEGDLGEKIKAFAILDAIAFMFYGKSMKKVIIANEPTEEVWSALAGESFARDWNNDKDAIYDHIKKALEDDQKWQKSFVSSQKKLATLADEALKEFEEGKTTPLDFSSLSSQKK